MGCESQQGRGHLSGAAGLAGWDLPPKLNFNLAHKSSSKSPPPLPVHSSCCVAALGSGTVPSPHPMWLLGPKGLPVLGSGTVT